MEFLDLLDTIDARDTYNPVVYTRDDPEYRTSVSTFRRNNRQNARFSRAVHEAARLIDDVRAGRRSDFVLREAMTTSDFPLLFGDVIDRVMLGNYAEWQPTWQNIVRPGTARDFRATKRLYITGGEAVLAQVKEQEEYPGASLGEGQYTVSVKKYGRRMPFSWEAILNDDMDALADVPARFARAARRSEERFVATLYAGASGPLAAVYSVGNKNIVTGNPVFSITALQTAMTVLSRQVDADGEPITIEMIELVVPPALEIPALNVLNAVQVEIGLVGQGLDAAAVTENRLIVANWMKSRLRLSVNPYLPSIASSANGDTSWYLFASPRAGRPAIEFVRLRGFEQPQLFMKSPNAVRVGGGAVNPLEGDFDTDSIDYKVRHVFGGGIIDPKMTVASNGSGS